MELNAMGGAMREREAGSVDGGEGFMGMAWPLLWKRSEAKRRLLLVCVCVWVGREGERLRQKGEFFLRFLLS